MTRIISGSARGRQLRTPAGERTRPTSDRVREALFSALASWFDSVSAEASATLAGTSFLDLFAGSGAVALEAASRGASRVVSVEKDRPTAELIRGNAKATRLCVNVVAGSVETFLDGPASHFDVVWLDPPYNLPTADVNTLLGKLTTGWLAADALVVVERSVREPQLAWPAQLSQNWLRRYGETVLYFGRTTGESHDQQ